MKLKILSEFGTPLNLRNCDGITVKFPYLGNRTLEKSNVEIIDVDKAIIKIDLSDFDIQGLNVGLEQNFKAEVKIGGEVLHVLFAKGLNVAEKDERKYLL